MNSASGSLQDTLVPGMSFLISWVALLCIVLPPTYFFTKLWRVRRPAQVAILIATALGLGLLLGVGGKWS